MGPDDLSVSYYSLTNLCIRKICTLSNRTEAFATQKATFNKRCMINCWNTSVNIFYVYPVSYLKACLCCFFCKRIEWPRNWWRICTLVLPRKCILLVSGAHWQPLGGIIIPPKEEQVSAVPSTWEDRCTQEPTSIWKLCMCVCETCSEVDFATPGQWGQMWIRVVRARWIACITVEKYPNCCFPFLLYFSCSLFLINFVSI